MIYDVQKANVLKRASAFLLDIILIACLAVGFMALLSLICDYDTHYDAFYSIQQTTKDSYVERYKAPGIVLNYDDEDNFSAREVEWINYYQEHGIDLGIDQDTYNALDSEQQTVFNAFATQASTEMTEALYANEEFIAEYNLWMSLTIMMISIGVLLAVAVWEFIIPLFLKNGQTVGKKVFGIAVMHTNGVRVRPFSMFVRSILGKYVFELMVPIFIVLMMYFGILNAIIGIVLLVLIVALEVGVFIYTRNTSHSLLHDLIAKTVTVDLASQMIFENEDERLEFLKQEQRELDERNNYRENGGFDFYNSALNYRGGKKIVESDMPSEDKSAEAQNAGEDTQPQTTNDEE